MALIPCLSASFSSVTFHQPGGRVIQVDQHLVVNNTTTAATAQYLTLNKFSVSPFLPDLKMRGSQAPGFFQVGEPPLQYITRWRIPEAAKALRHRGTSLAEVAISVGYESEAAFNRVFKRWIGQTPGAYRQAILAQTSTAD